MRKTGQTVLLKGNFIFILIDFPMDVDIVREKIRKKSLVKVQAFLKKTVKQIQ